jgi:Ala-tRNA(Pro) deacylase
MSIANRLEHYMGTHGVCYEVLPHRETHTSLETAHETHVPARCLAKSVLLTGPSGYLVAVLPASRHIDLAALSDRLGRRFVLASQAEMRRLFVDCDPGSVPPVGEAYGVATVVDGALYDEDDLYFEGGDHTDLVHVGRTEFCRLMTRSKRASFSSGPPAA